MNLKILNELDRLLKRNPSLKNNKHSLCQVVNGNFDIELTSVDNSSIYALAEQIDNECLKLYFTNVWQPETKKYKYSGLAIIDEVNKMNPSNVIDIGCGYNEFKGKINNLVGLDPYNDKADIKSTILDYQTDTEYDVAICLGSINFGSSDKILSELSAVVNLLCYNGLMYFRVNPGLAHNVHESLWINFYDWDSSFIANAAIYLGCELVTLRQDDNRLYFVLRKLS